MNKIDESLNRSHTSKRARSSEPVDYLQGHELWRKIISCDFSYLKSIHVAAWETILTELTEYLKDHPRALKVRDVFYRTVVQTYKHDSLQPKLIRFFEVVRNSHAFVHGTPLSERFVELAETIYFRNPNFALLFNQLGFMFNFIAVFEAAIEGDNMRFQALLRIEIDLSRVKQDSYLTNCVLRNLNKESIDLYIQTGGVFSVLSAHQLIANTSLTEEEVIDILEYLIFSFEMDLNVQDEYGITPLELCYRLQKPLIIDYLISLLSTGKSTCQTVKTVTKYKHYHAWDPDSKPLPCAKFYESTLDHLATAHLMKRVHLEVFKDDLITEEGGLIFLKEISKKNPQTLSLQSLRNHRHMNQSLYHYFLFKRVSHVWSVDPKTIEPVLKKPLSGEAFFAPISILFFVQFLRLIQSDFDLPELDFAIDALQSFKDGPVHDLESISLIHQSNISPEVLVGGFNQHLAINVLFRDWIAYCDRGGVTTTPGFKVYKVVERIEFPVVSEMLNAQQVTASTYLSDKKLEEKMKLTEVFYRSMRSQKVGNCTETSTEAALYLLMVLYHKTHTRLSFEESASLAKGVYKKIAAAYRYYTAYELIESGYAYLKERSAEGDDLFFSLIFSVYLKLKAKPSKLTPFIDESRNILNHLGHLLSELSKVPT